MKLMTAEIAATLPPFYTNEDVKDPMVMAKFFTPWSSWTWYATEYDPETKTCFGFVQGMEAELGYFSIDELESIKGPMGLGIERDIHWTPVPLSEAKGK